jgi:hypothetical protein
MFSIDWSNPEFPVIRSADGNGEDLDIVTITVIRHHLEAAQSHYRAILGVLSDYAEKATRPSRTDSA